MSYYVFRSCVSPNKPHAKRLEDGTIIRGGFEVAYDEQAFGKRALLWAKMAAKRVKGAVWVKNKNNKYVKL